jgi:hypothetical protein
MYFDIDSRSMTLSFFLRNFIFECFFDIKMLQTVLNITFMLSNVEACLNKKDSLSERSRAFIPFLMKQICLGEHLSYNIVNANQQLSSGFNGK